MKTDTNNSQLQIPGYILHSTPGHRQNSGIVIYINQEMVAKNVRKISKLTHQLMMIETEKLSIILFYKSKDSNTAEFCKDIMDLYQTRKEKNDNIIMMGDMNLDYISNNNQEIIITIEQLGLKQIITEATHDQGGLLDHMYIRLKEHEIIDSGIYSVYYSDHDSIFMSY